MTRRRHWALALLLIILTWPLVPRLGAALRTDPAGEAAAHLWGHAAALRGEGPLWIQSAQLGWPDGVQFALIDPGNLPIAALGWALAGPAGAHNLLALAGVAAAGAGAAALARRLRTPAHVAAALAMASPPILSASITGMTEHYLVGLCAVQLAWAARAARSGAPTALLGASALLALLPALGPYNALWGALLNLGLLAWTARAAGPATGTRVLRLLGTQALGLVLAAPVLVRAASDRLGMSGGAQQRGLPPIERLPDAFRGGMQRGADLIDLVAPLPLTGGAPSTPASAYQGLGVLVCALWAAWTRPRLRAPLLAAGALLLLSLGATVSVGGAPLEIDGEPLRAPVGWLTAHWPALGRISRWGRAAAVAAVILAPLAAAALPRAKAPRAALLLLLMVDLVLLAPGPWPMPMAPLPAVPAGLALPMPAGQPAVFTWPPSTSGPPGRGRWRDETALAQLVHGRPLAGTIMNAPMSPAVERAFVRLQRALPAGDDLRPAMRPLAEAGFGALLVDLRRVHLPPESHAALSACLGPPIEAQPDTVLWALPPRGCRPQATVPKPPAETPPPSAQIRP